MRFLFVLLRAALFLMVLGSFLPLKADVMPDFIVQPNLLLLSPSDSLDEENAYALSSAILSTHLSSAAFGYSQLLNDSTQSALPFRDKKLVTYVVHPSKGDTLFQIDLRLYSPSPVGRRLNRMLIIRPYDKEERPCLLFTHGSNANLQSWVTYFFLGIPDMLQRGFAVAIYENWNSLQHVNGINSGDVLYKQWEEFHFEDDFTAGSDDLTLQRAHYMLYQYAKAAAAFVHAEAGNYGINSDHIFPAGHSAGGLASMLLTFADSSNFRHPLFESVGDERAKLYPDLNADAFSTKAVFSSAAGLTDPNIPGVYSGPFLQAKDAGKTVIMIHGKNDPAANISYGPGLWSNFVDTVKLIGPLNLRYLLDDIGVKNYTFVNCIGEHGVHLYPFTPQDGSGRFQQLLLANYPLPSMNNSLFVTDTGLVQLKKYTQQLRAMFEPVSILLEDIINGYDLSHYPSAVYTWQTSNYSNPMTLAESSWAYSPVDCGIEGAMVKPFDRPVGVRNLAFKTPKELSFSLYPNPAGDRIFFQLTEEREKPYEVAIFDVLGRAVFRNKYRDFGSASVDISPLERGIYFFQVTSASESLAGVKGFMKQ